MRTALGLAVLALAILLTLAEMETMAHPAATVLSRDGLPVGPGEPGHVHALWAIVIVLLLFASVRLLSDGILGRLVRGRGLTPAPERE